VFRCLLLRWQCDHARRSDLALAPGAIRSRALAHRHLAFEPYPTIGEHPVGHRLVGERVERDELAIA
jgi:hypothetical protein